MLAGLPLTVPEDLIDFQHSAEAVAQLLKRKGFTVVKLFANRLYDSSFDKAAVLAEVKKTFLHVNVSGTALFAYVGHMSAGYYTYQQEVQISNEGTAIEKGKKCMQSRSSNTPRVHIMTYAGEFERSKRVRSSHLTALASAFKIYCECGEPAWIRPMVAARQQVF